MRGKEAECECIRYLEEDPDYMYSKGYTAALKFVFKLVGISLNCNAIDEALYNAKMMKEGD